MRRLLHAAWLAAVLAVLAGCATEAPKPPLQVKVMAINDLHGNLRPPSSGVSNAVRRTPARAGGLEHMATAVAELRAKNPNSVFVGAGDLIGASPLLSSLLHDEPTIEALNLIGLEVSAMGNHELDRGSAELLRQQNGGCHPKEGCKGPKPFAGATFKYLAANTIVEASGKTLLPPYWIKRFEGVPVAFIGLTLKDTPSVIVPAAIKGLRFRDEAETVNQLVPELRRQGIEAIVVLLHEGGFPTGDYNECPGINGPVVDIVKRLDKAVDLVISGHTHRAYNCRIDGRLVTSADRFGTILTEINLTLDRKTGDVIAAEAENLLLAPERFAKHVATGELIAAYERIVAPLARRPVGRLSTALLARASPAGETAVGRTIADAQLEATRDAGAQIALMNIGGVRSQLGRDDQLDISYEDLFRVQPFYNQLVTMTLSGAELLQLLEQQWDSSGRGRLLQVSAGLQYSWSDKRAVGSRVVPGSAMLGGKAIDPQASYRVTVNSFMADGGDGFGVLVRGRDRSTGMLDIDAFEAYFKTRPVFTPDPTPRITRLE